MEYLAIDQLKPHPENPRKISPNAVKKLAASIKANPNYFEARPIIVSLQPDSTYLILGGHQRLKAARLVGLTKVPVHIMKGLTKKKELEILLLDNKSSGTTDRDKLFAFDKEVLKVVGIKAPPKVVTVPVVTGATVKVHFTDEELEEIGFTPTADQLKEVFMEEG